MIAGVFSISGRPGPTVKMTSADGEQYLPDYVLNDLFGDSSTAKAVLITCETNDVRFCLGATVATLAAGVGHVLAAGASVRLSHPEAVRTFNFCSKTASTAGVLQITAEY